jgi:hypothetical protein
MKPNLLKMTALSTLLLVSPALSDLAAAQKPVIRIARPPVKLKINMSALAGDTAGKRAGGDVAEAGPQPEPPTLPRLKRKQAVLDVPPLPRARPQIADLGGEGSDDPVEPGGEALDSPPLPASLGHSPALEELFDTTGGNLDDIRDAASLLEDGPGTHNAIPDNFRDQGNGEDTEQLGGKRELGGQRLGGYDWRAARGDWTIGGNDGDKGVDLTGGAPTSPAADAPDGSGVASDGGCGSVPESYGTVSNCGTNDDGQTEAAGTREGRSAPEGRTESGHENWTATRDEDSLFVHAIQFDEKGQKTGEFIQDIQTFGGTERTVYEWRDANGEIIERREITRRIRNNPAGQPNPEEGGVADHLCAGWNPMTGCAGKGVTARDMTGQPRPGETGAPDERSAGASVGAEAVTNGGDGSFIAGGNSGNGGRGEPDPCIAARESCGNGPDGPDGPDGPVAAIEAAAVRH